MGDMNPGSESGRGGSAADRARRCGRGGGGTGGEPHHRRAGRGGLLPRGPGRAARGRGAIDGPGGRPRGAALRRRLHRCGAHAHLGLDRRGGTAARTLLARTARGVPAPGRCRRHGGHRRRTGSRASYRPPTLRAHPREPGPWSWACPMAGRCVGCAGSTAPGARCRSASRTRRRWPRPSTPTRWRWSSTAGDVRGRRSTLVDATVSPVRVLREGALPAAFIEGTMLMSTRRRFSLRRRGGNEGGSA